MFNAELRKLNADGMPDWRNRFRERLRAIAGRYPPRHEALADTACTLVEGGLILGRVLRTTRSCRGRSSCSVISSA